MRYKRKNIKKLVVVTSLITILAGCNILQGSEGATFSKLKFLNRQVKKLYLGELNQEELEKGIYNGYIGGLDDSVSSYLDEAEYKANLAYEEGKEIGTGLTYTWGLDGNHLVITEVVPNSPADQAGIKVGDKIIKVDDIKVIYANENLLDKALSQAVEGSKNTYLIKEKDNSSKEKSVVITKALIEKPSLKTDIVKNIGYIKLENIKTGTSEEVKTALTKLKNQGIQKAILDIRNIYSNNLDETLKLCDLFMDGTLAFKIKDKAGEMKNYSTTNGKIDMEMVLLMDNSTRGIIEALPAALKGSIPLVGTASAGSGYLSKLFSLEDGTGLRLATGILYTRDNKDVTKDGIAVDEEVFQSVDSIIELIDKGTMSYASDMQLQAAINKLV